MEKELLLIFGMPEVLMKVKDVFLMKKCKLR